MTTVLLADDEPIVRAGVREILQRDPDIDVVGEAGDGRTALSMTDAHLPDVVLLDLRMPQLDGLGAAREIARRHPDIAIVILTTFDDRDYVVEALKIGVRGFLLKASDPRELAIAVTAAADGGTYLSPRVAAHIIEEFTQQAGDSAARARRRIASLTDREHSILAVLATGASNRAIGKQIHLAESSVKTHVTAILQKLGLTNRVQAAVLARDAGLGHSPRSA